MKDQIKIQVSEDGLFGTPVNPIIHHGITLREYKWAHKKFADTHPQLPLTTPQIPKSVVMGEVVWQGRDDEETEWITFINKSDVKIAKFLHGYSIRQAYGIITQVPNSELPDIDFGKPLDPDNYDDNGNPIINSEPKEINIMDIEQIKTKMRGSMINHILSPGIQYCLTLLDELAQQQPVSKSEESKHRKPKEQILKECTPTSNGRYYWPIEVGIAMEAYAKQEKEFYKEKSEQLLNILDDIKKQISDNDTFSSGKILMIIHEAQPPVSL